MKLTSFKNAFQRRLKVIVICAVLLACVYYQPQCHCLEEQNNVITQGQEVKITGSPDSSSTPSPSNKLKNQHDSGKSDTKSGDDDDEEDDGGLFGPAKVVKSGPASESGNDDEGDDEEASEKSGEKETGKDKKGDDEDEEEDYDEGEGGGDGSCDGRLSSFVRQFEGSAYLPDDIEEVTEFMHQHGVYGHMKHLNDTMAVMDRLKRYGEKLKDNKDMADTMKYVGSVVGDKMYEAKISPQCMADFMTVGNGLRGMEMWALKFIDSFGMPFLEGMLHGHFSSFGQFDQCIGIKSPKLESGRHIYGRYCQFHATAFTPLIESYTPQDEEIYKQSSLYGTYNDLYAKTGIEKYMHRDFSLFMTQVTDNVDEAMFHFGICIPSSCTGDDIQRFINELVYPILKISVTVNDKWCDVHPDLKEIQVDNYQWTSIIIFTILSGIVLLCTLIHLCIWKRDSDGSQNVPNQGMDEKNNNNDPNPVSPSKQANLPTVSKPAYLQVILSFSAIENTRKLITISPSRYASLDTLRVLLSLLIFPINSLGLYRAHLPKEYRHMDGLIRLEMVASNNHWTNRIPGLWFDGFVFLFGVLTIFQQFKHLKRSFGEFSYSTYICQRWFRLSVAMFGTVLTLYLLPLTGNGPMWHYNEQYVVAPCKSWSTLASSFFYYSNWNYALDNYNHVTKPILPICNPQTWFVSAFSQLYLLAPVVFLPLYYWPQFGLSFTIFFIVLSPLLTAAPRLILGYPSYIETTSFISFFTNLQAIMHSHMNPLLYTSSLFIGLLTGYLIKCKPKLRLGGPIVKWTIWLCSAASVGVIVAWHDHFMEINVVHNPDSVLGWFMYYKLAWSFFLGYTCFLCCTGRGGILNRILTIPKLQPLAKLSYCIYLLRGLMVFYRKGYARTTSKLYPYESFANIFIDYLLTAAFAVVLHLLFEAPTLGIMNVLYGNDCHQDYGKDSNLTKIGSNGNGKHGTLEKSEKTDQAESKEMQSSQLNETIADLI